MPCNPDIINPSDYGIGLDIYPMWNNFYGIWLYKSSILDPMILSSIYNNLTNEEYNIEIKNNKFWFLAIWKKNNSNFEFLYNKILKQDQVLNSIQELKNETIWEFNFTIKYKFKEWLTLKEKENLMNWNFPYKIVLSNGIMWMWDPYKILKENWNNVFELDIFNQKWTYFVDYYNRVDTFILTTNIPENPYFSEITIQFLNTWAYNNDEKKQLILNFVKNLEWTDSFSIE